MDPFLEVGEYQTAGMILIVGKMTEVEVLIHDWERRGGKAVSLLAL